MVLYPACPLMQVNKCAAPKLWTGLRCTITQYNYHKHWSKFLNTNVNGGERSSMFRGAREKGNSDVICVTHSPRYSDNISNPVHNFIKYILRLRQRHLHLHTNDNITPAFSHTLYHTTHSIQSCNWKQWQDLILVCASQKSVMLEISEFSKNDVSNKNWWIHRKRSLLLYTIS